MENQISRLQFLPEPRRSQYKAHVRHLSRTKLRQWAVKRTIEQTPRPREDLRECPKVPAFDVDQTLADAINFDILLALCMADEDDTLSGCHDYRDDTAEEISPQVRVLVEVRVR